MKKDHFKCHLCDKKHEQIYYHNYKNLQIHFEKSHFACRKEECLEKCFIVFKTKDQLEDHLVSLADRDKSAQREHTEEKNDNDLRLHRGKQAF